MAGLPIVFRAIQCWIGEHLLAVLWVVSSPRNPDATQDSEAICPY